jgi:hypothetical protein
LNERTLVRERREKGVTKPWLGALTRSEKREDAKKALHKMIVTALNNCSEEGKIDPACYPIVAQAIIDQVTQPHVTGY